MSAHKTAHASVLAAFEAAALSINGVATADGAADRHGVHRSSVSHARLILAHGTEAEVAAVRSGAMPLRTTADAIRQRIPKDQRERRPQVRTDEREAAIKADSDLWKQLIPALDALVGMPSPASVAQMVRRNPQRITAVNRVALQSLEWLQEFVDAWTA